MPTPRRRGTRDYGQIAREIAVAGLAGLDRQRDRQVGVAGAGRAEEADVAVLGDPGELREVEDQRFFGARLGSEVEVFECLVGGEGGVADPLPGAGGVAREDLASSSVWRNRS
jgi:hypothetical protein